MPLSDLAAALAAATGPDRALDERMAVEVFGLTLHRPDPGEEWPSFVSHDGPAGDGDGGYADDLPAYTSDLNAITGAIEARWPLPGWQWSVEAVGAAVIWDEPGFKRIYAEHKQGLPAMGLCLAAVRLAMAEEGPAR